MILVPLVNIILMAILMVAGYYLRNKGVLTDDGESALTYLLVNVTMPAMVVNAMNIKFSFKQLKTGAALLINADTVSEIRRRH